MINLYRRSFTFGLAAMAIAPPRLAWAETAKITFVLTNDIYQMGDTEMPDGKRRGGFARLAAVVKAERAKGGHVVFTHGGDTLSPSLMSGVDQGAHILNLTNMLNPDIFVPGNHEFDFGKAVFQKRMAEAKFPLFAANMQNADGKALPGFKDRDIVTIDGIRVGFTGAAHDNTPRLSNPGDLKFRPTVETMKAQAEALRRDGADLVVVVMHADRSQGAELVESHVADLVLTGHNHDLFIGFDGRSAMVESSYDAHYVTIVEVNVGVKQQDNHRTVDWWPQFRVIDTATVAPDPEFVAVVAEYERELDRQMNVPLATTTVRLDTRDAVMRSGEAAFGNLIADAIRERTRAEAAIMNGGGVRGSKVYEPGDAISRRDILGELPFANHLITLDVKGSDLRTVLENGFSRIPRAGRFPQVSGMKIEFDPHQPPGSRIVSIAIGGAPLDPDRTYRIATNDFLARGGDGYTAFGNLDPIVPLEDAPLISNELMVYLGAIGTVRTGVEGRIIAK
jgi:2',3'-cyclic-nucleotide 2'-phosphodiesterase (5'-nucleotidase family)